MTISKVPDWDDPWFAKAGKMIDAAMKLKKVMQRKKIRSAKAKCPFCQDGHLHGRLAGRKDHIRMWCDVCEDVRLME